MRMKLIRRVACTFMSTMTSLIFALSLRGKCAALEGDGCFLALETSLPAALCCICDLCICDLQTEAGKMAKDSEERTFAIYFGIKETARETATAANTASLTPRPMPSEELYGAGSAEDLARSYGGGDSLTAANLVTSAAQAAAMQHQHAQQEVPGAASCSGGGKTALAEAGAQVTPPPPVAVIPQSFQHAPPRSSGGRDSGTARSSGSGSPSSLAAVRMLCHHHVERIRVRHAAVLAANIAASAS